MSKGVHKQTFTTCKILYNLQELYSAFKEKHPNVNTSSQSYIPRDTNDVFSLAQKWLTVCVCSAYHNVVLLVDAMDLDVT